MNVQPPIPPLCRLSLAIIPLYSINHSILSDLPLPSLLIFLLSVEQAHFVYSRYLG
jgi:hypothetical protein